MRGTSIRIGAWLLLLLCNNPGTFVKAGLPGKKPLKAAKTTAAKDLPKVVIKQVNGKTIVEVAQPPPPPPSSAVHAHEMSAPMAVANILADLCPHGMMPIAFGLAADGGTGPVVGVATVLFFGFLSWYSLLSYGRAADAVLDPHSGQESLASVWSEAVSPKTTYIPNYGCALLTLGCLLFYSAFIGDLFGALASGLLPSWVPNIFRKRSTVLLCLHALPILPLCLLKDLSALFYSSMLGLAGIFYTVYFVAQRMIDGSYAAGGKYFELMKATPHLQPAAQKAFAGTKYLKDIPPFHVGKGMITLMNMCCVAFACHYNAVKYFMELKDKRVVAFGNTMGVGILGTGTVFCLMMIFGYGTFGAHAQALLLNNYHRSQDVMAIWARAFTGLAIISGYPLMFAGLKSAVFSITKLDDAKVKNQRSKQNLLSMFLLSLVAIGACFVSEHELATVIGIVGAIFGSFVIYMLPGVLNNNLLKQNKVTPFIKGEAFMNNVLIAFGVVFAILGTWVSLSEAGGH